MTDAVTAAEQVAVIGQGYVGLPLAVEAARAGYAVSGVDVDGVRVEALNAGSSPVGDIADAELQEVLDSGRYHATTDFGICAQAAVVVFCVPTPYDDDAPDLSFVKDAARRASQHLQAGTLVILESTTYPGTTEEVLAPILEEGSGLEVGADLQVAFSPERIDPGNVRFQLRNTPKVVGGMTPESTRRAASFYGLFVDEVVEVSGPKTAEMTKLLENTFRHINIALVNELAVLCQDLGIDIWEVVEAASTKPFGFMPFYPGPGVGGHCIPVDPMYLSWRVRQFGGAAKFIELARDVNDAMPMYVANRVQELLNEHRKPVNGSDVLVLGVAYKRDVADLRESPALPVMERLARKGAVLQYHDPHVPQLEFNGGELKSVELTDELLADQDCALVLTDHRAVDYERVGRLAPLVFDTRNCVPVIGEHVHRL